MIPHTIHRALEADFPNLFMYYCDGHDLIPDALTTVWMTEKGGLDAFSVAYFSDRMHIGCIGNLSSWLLYSDPNSVPAMHDQLCKWAKARQI